MAREGGVVLHFHCRDPASCAEIRSHLYIKRVGFKRRVERIVFNEVRFFFFLIKPLAADCTLYIVREEIEQSKSLRNNNNTTVSQGGLTPTGRYMSFDM